MSLFGDVGERGDHAAPADVNGAVNSGHRPQQGPRDVLVAERDPRGAALLRDAAHAAFPDATLHVASELRQVRLLLATVRPALVAIDLNMAESALRDLMDEAHSLNPEIRIVVVAGHGDDDRLLPALRAGAAGFLIKYDAVSLIAAQLRETHAGALPVSAALARQLIRHIDRAAQDARPEPRAIELLTWIAAGDSPAQAGSRMGLAPAAAHALFRATCEGMKVPRG